MFAAILFAAILFAAILFATILFAASLQVLPRLLAIVLAAIVNAYDGGKVDAALPRIMRALGDVESVDASSGDVVVSACPVLASRVADEMAALALTNEAVVGAEDFMPPECLEEDTVASVSDVVGLVSGRLIPSAGFDERRWVALLRIVVVSPACSRFYSNH